MTRSSASYALAKTLTVTLLAIAALFALDTVLAKTERSKRRAEAERLYENGERLLQAGRSDQAVRQFRAAIAIQRDNQQYQLALGRALQANRQAGEAEATLSEVVERDPLSGPANLALARVLAQEGKAADADSYYHRAIYGRWKGDPPGNELRVRFELADLLRAQNSKAALLAELLPLQEQAPGDAATQQKLGVLFMDAGSPARAVEVFRGIIRHDPEDADARATLGDAELALGNYAAAREAFLVVQRLRANDLRARARYELSSRALELDPTIKGLTQEEQLLRSRKLLTVVLAEMNQCVGDARSAAAQQSIQDAEQTLKRGRSYSENLDLAKRLWGMRPPSCKPSSGSGEDAMALVLSKT
jgi:tetratricopeptide (TPR) repeat protein